MPIRRDTNPRPLALPPELQGILQRNGMSAQVVGSSNGFALVVQGHDSPVLTYPISEKQLRLLTDWGSNSANKKAYNTFASIVAADFDMPMDFVHARNANGRVAMGLHGYRVGVGEYGRMPAPSHHHHMMGPGFLGWTPRQQGGWHMRRIGHDLYYPGAPMVPMRPDGRMKPGELAAGGYGFYYKGQATAPVAQQPLDVLAELQTVIRPQVPQRPQAPAIPYEQAITSDVYFSNEKLQEVLGSHGIVIADQKLTIQSASLPVDLAYNLSEEEFAKLTHESIKDVPIQERLDIINQAIGMDFKDAITMEMLNSDKQIDLALHDELVADLNQRLAQTEQLDIPAYEPKVTLDPGNRDGVVMMDGADLAALDPSKGWFREGKNGREVMVGDIKVEPAETEGKYKMSAVIDGKVYSYEISQKQYDKFLTIDDYNRMKLFAKVFNEVDIKKLPREGEGSGRNFGAHILAALTAGLVVGGEVLHHRHHPRPEFYGPSVYYKPGVDTPRDVAAREFDAMMNQPNTGPHRGM